MTWNPYDPCPCGCGVTGWKLTKPLPVRGYDSDREEHANGCTCKRHTGGRSKSRGQRTQSKHLKAAAKAEGRTMEVAPTHEEQARLLVHYEVKSGQQIPKGIYGDWTRKAIQQAESFAMRQVPHRKWALVLDPPGRERPLLLMDYEAFLSLVSEIQELP